jgi:dGTPase
LPADQAAAARRRERYYPDSPKPGDDRAGDEAQRDRDRILYATAFRRLAEVTQVVSSRGAHIFHNRLTHSLKVAQVGGACARWLLKQSDADLVASCGGLDPMTVEAAALAHDLGHPPFGHEAEEELQRLLAGPPTGVSSSTGELQDLLKSLHRGPIFGPLAGSFEGNAQSFRIVTKLAAHSHHHPGLNLSRATLAAILKYPWLRVDGPDDGPMIRRTKWGAYPEEQEIFNWAREGQPDSGDDAPQTTEASLMDWADDVSYSVHDMEDFYRAGLIPLDQLRFEGEERERFLDAAIAKVRQKLARYPSGSQYSADELRDAFARRADAIPVTTPFEGTMWQRAALRSFTGELIGTYIRAVRLVEPSGPDTSSVDIIPEAKSEVLMLKELTWHYVIDSPMLVARQYGQRQVIRGLFVALMDAASHRRDWPIFGPDSRKGLEDANGDEQRQARLVTDSIASMTEAEAIALHRRMLGATPNQALDVAGI